MRISIAKIIKKAKEWSSLHYRLLPVTTTKEYALYSDMQYTEVKHTERVHVTPVQYIGESPRQDVIGMLPERYVCLLQDVSIIGASNVILCKEKFLYDLLVNKKDTYNITDRGLFRIWNSPIHIANYYFLCFKNKGERIKSAICLVGNYSGNYYHFIFEILIKWFLLDHIDIPVSVPIVVDASARDIPQFKELLSLFSGDRELIYVEKEELRTIELLYYPSLVNSIPPNVKKMEYLLTEDIVFDYNALLYLRNRFLSYIKGYTINTPKKFFISRKNTKWRQYNEEDVIQVVNSLGYEVVYPETMSIKEQFCLFNQADEIIGASGAALSNIICCKPKAKVLVLVSVRIDAAIFSSIARCFDIELNYFSGTITNYNNVQSDFVIDCNQLRKVLQ